MPVQLRAVTPPEIPDLWPQIRDRIASCCERSGGKYAPADVLRNLIASAMNLWIALDEDNAIKALLITEIAAYPRITVCRLLACTGDDAALWVDLLAPIEGWAKSQGCAAMEPICRPGWERRLKPMGYRKTQTRPDVPDVDCGSLMVAVAVTSSWASYGLRNVRQSVFGAPWPNRQRSLSCPWL